MPKTLKERLIEKGWSEEEVAKVLDILYSKDKIEKHKIMETIMNPIVYWTSLLITIVGNILISVVLIPLLITLNKFIYIIIFFIAISFGLLFNLIITQIDLKQKHHLIASIFIPAIAIINLFFITMVANQISNILKTQNHQNPILIGVSYAVFFMIPYIISRIRNK